MAAIYETKTAVKKATNTHTEFSIDYVTSSDGTTIGYRYIGTGPGLIVMHGGLRASQHYERLARALADCFTVYIPDRRGRGLSGPAGDDYSFVKECEDLRAVMQKSKARMVFGHSGGALFALEAALKFPIDRLILYEPAVSIHGSLPLEWIPAFEHAVNRKDFAEAMVLVIQGLPLNWMSRMPHWILYPFFSLMLHGKQGDEIRQLLATGAREAKESIRLDSTQGRYRAIRSETLLLGGAKSPSFLLDVLPILAETLPHARLVKLPGLDHSAPDEDAPETVVAAFREFLFEGVKIQ